MRIVTGVLTSQYDPSGFSARVLDFRAVAERRSCRRAEPSLTVLVLPVASVDAMPRLRRAADDLVVLSMPHEFVHPRTAYRAYRPVDVAEAAALLDRARAPVWAQRPFEVARA